MAKRFFGTDGIRGRVGIDPITPERVMHLGWAAGRVLGKSGQSKVVIGKDTRVSGYLLESALQAGLAAAGTNVTLLGPMPTPAIAYITQTTRADAGIVISASHNPYHDNGIKFFSPAGRKLPDSVEFAIEEAMGQPMETVDSQHLGKAMRFEDAKGRYIEFCKGTVPQRVKFDGLKIVVDCANGAGYQVAPHVFEELGAQVIPIYDKPDGFNINDGCGSTYPQALRTAVRAHEADIGLALDGDGDRVLLCDEKGELIDGDQILYVLAMRRKQAGDLSGGIVGTVMTNLGLELACADNEIPFARSKVGDRYVLEKLVEHNWQLGGESSGHIICLDKSSTGDGIIAALEMIMAVVEARQPLSELIAGMPLYPQKMINVRFEPDSDISTGELAESAVVKSAVADAEAELAKTGRVLIRASGTEPVVRVMVEGADADQVDRITHQLAGVVEQAATA